MINGNLEYLMSSLPNLSFQNSEGSRSKVFFILNAYASSSDKSNDMVAILDDEAEKFLSSKQFSVFQEIRLHDIHKEVFQNTNNLILTTFSKYDFQLKQEIKLFRIAQKSNDNSNKTQFEMIDGLSENPLEAEIQVLQLQWNKLELLSIGHYDDFSALIIYRLKLQLLLRWWSFDANKGFEIFNEAIHQN